MTDKQGRLLAAYLEAAFTLSEDPEGNPLIDAYWLDDVAPETRDRICTDLARFTAAFGPYVEARADDPWAQAGHDLWLTRNGHGAGFWDGDWPEPVGDILTAAAELLGPCELYLGDDGLIYVA